MRRLDSSQIEHKLSTAFKREIRADQGFAKSIVCEESWTLDLERQAAGPFLDYVSAFFGQLFRR
jgi:hypothetical protein